MNENDYIFINIDVDLINPDYIHEGRSRDQLDFVIKKALAPSCGNDLRVYQQVPKAKQTPETRQIPVGWGKVSPRPRFSDDKTTDTY
jgi:hypothetical protein